MWRARVARVDRQGVIDFGQFRFRPILGRQSVGPSKGAPKGGGPNLEKVEPRRVEPRRVEPRRVGPRRVGPRRLEPRRVEPRRVGGPKFRAFFPFLRHNFLSSFSLLGLLHCRVKPRRPHQTGPPGLHTTTRELQTRTFERPGLQKHHQNSTRRHPETQKERNGGGKGRKRAKFWAIRRRGVQWREVQRKVVQGSPNQQQPQQPQPQRAPKGPLSQASSEEPHAGSPADWAVASPMSDHSPNSDAKCLTHRAHLTSLSLTVKHAKFASRGWRSQGFEPPLSWSRTRGLAARTSMTQTTTTTTRTPTRASCTTSEHGT